METDDNYSYHENRKHLDLNNGSNILNGDNMIAHHVHNQGWSQQHRRLQEIRSKLENQFLNNKIMYRLNMIKILAMTNTDQTMEIKSFFSVATTSILLMLTGFLFYDNWVKAKYCSNGNNNSHHNNDVNSHTGDICP